MLIMKIKVLMGLLISVLFLTIPSFANEKNIIKVGISNQSFSAWEYKTADFISDNIIKIVDMSQNTSLEDIKANTQITIEFINNAYNVLLDNKLKYENLSGPLLLSSNAPIGIVNLNRKGTPAKYKGMIEIRTSKSNNGFNIINVIDIDNYLRGVVPNEMPVSFGLEALKAQAIAARNYATNASISPNYDVVDSTASQVYYGANSYREISDNAVLKTKGIYALYRNKPITALYFSTSPGITDDWDDVFSDGFNKGIHPYLKPRYDFDSQRPLKSEKEVEEFYLRNDNGLDTNSPKFRWSVEFDKSELENLLTQTLVQQSNAGLVTPKYDGSIPITGVKEIKPIHRTISGKITELSISTDIGEFKVKKELGIRRVLKKNGAMLPSANFFIKTSEDDEKKGIFGIFDIEGNYPKKFMLYGGGFGHGVGMSQFGAYAMAKKGKKYPEILHHYYTNIILSTIPKEVYYNEYNVNYNSVFYFEPNIYKEVYLFINNHKNATEFNFKINNIEFNNTSEFANNRLIKINITQYLKEGLNTISFQPLNYKNKGKTVTYQVEFINGK